MKLKKHVFLPILLSLSVFFSSTVAMSASAYASAAPQTAAVYQLAEAAPNNTAIPEVEKPAAPDRSGDVKPRKDASFFEDLLEKIAVMFLVYVFIEAINSLLNDFFHDGDSKIKITPKEKQNPTNQRQENNQKRMPGQEV